MKTESEKFIEVEKTEGETSGAGESKSRLPASRFFCVVYWGAVILLSALLISTHKMGAFVALVFAAVAFFPSRTRG